MEQIMSLVNYFIITKSDVSQNVNFKSKQKQDKEERKRNRNKNRKLMALGAFH